MKQKLLCKILFVYLMFFSLDVFSQPQLEYFKDGDIYQALHKARATEKLLLVEFYAPWNYRSKWQHSTINESDTVSTFLHKNFILFQFDTETTVGADFAKRYDVSNYPLLLVFNPNGNVIDKIDKTLSPIDFITHLESVVYQTQSDTAWELHQIEAALDNMEIDKAQALFEKVLSQQGNDIINKSYWSLFSNKNLTSYNSASYNFIIEHLEQFNSTIESSEVQAFLLSILRNHSISLLTDFQEITQVQLGLLHNSYTSLGIYDEIDQYLLQMVESRMDDDINNYILVCNKLQNTMNEESSFNIILTLEFIISLGNKEQLLACIRILKSQMKQTSIPSQVTMLENLMREFERKSLLL